MANNLIPPVNPQDETPSKRNNLIDATEIAGGIIFGGIAVALFEAGFHIWGFIFGFLAVVCGLTVAAHHLKKFGLKYVKTGLVVSLILAAILFGFLALHKPPLEPKPSLTLSLYAGDQPDNGIKLLNNSIELTNDFLVVTDRINNTFANGAC